MTDRAAAPTPSEELAQKVTQVFREKEFIRPADQQRLLNGLTGGTLSAEDWITLAENALAAEQEGDRR
ncbi:hypothetical protein SAMN04488058_10312 [Deinococcus reticulitermitis]|uniref:Uncharacterized protein n=1 Tax=Deinococcus reticulitermitis TaxID=856736 RepID=A0A1H6V8W6_9DEIO|nr:hypothetical protein [Deinococcus reticulitermitis]SEI98207.1 hypothetical protein SAMN04488058_10312 [Deinococcus reticulitermitis]